MSIPRPVNTITIDSYRRFGFGRRFYAWSAHIRTDSISLTLFKQGRYTDPTECADAALKVADRFKEAA